MLAIVAQPEIEDPALVEVEPPTSPARGEIVCRSLQIGVCGTDREILESRKPMVPQGQPHLILGHECLGRVEGVGDEVVDIVEGDLVVPMVRRGRPGAKYRVDMLAMGDYTERGIVEEHGFAVATWKDQPQHVVKVAPRLESLAVFTEPLSVAEKAVNEAILVQRGRLGETVWSESPPRVLVTGMGPIGFAGVIAAVCRGWPVTMFGRDPEDSFRAELAREFGAEYLPQDQLESRVRDVEADGFDLLLECTGNDGVLLRVLETLASRGVSVWLGSSQAPAPRPHNVSLLMRTSFLRNHLHLGSVNAAPRDFIDALAHLDQLQTTHPQTLARMITDRVAPADALWHYRNRRPQGIKTVIEYD